MPIKIRTRSPPEKKRVYTSFEIGELKEPWEDYCRANNISSVDALCQIIQKLTGVDSSKNPVAVRQAKEGATVKRPDKPYAQTPTQEKGRGRRFYLRLTPSESRAVETQAKADGFSHPTKWVVALIRARLTDHPQFSESEVTLLGESNHQLLAIGRNLNQIAHALNASKGKPKLDYNVEQVEALSKAIKSHVQKVGTALRASIHRWRLD